MSEQLHTINDACAALRVGRTYLYGLINEGQIKVLKIGRKSLVPQSSIDGFIASLPEYKSSKE